MGAHGCHTLLLGTSEHTVLAGSLICSGRVVLCLNNHFCSPSWDRVYTALPQRAPGDTRVCHPAVRAGAQCGAVLKNQQICSTVLLPTATGWVTMALASLVLKSAAPISSASSSGPSLSPSMAWSPQPAWTASPRRPSPGWTSTAPSLRFGQVGGPAPVQAPRRSRAGLLARTGGREEKERGVLGVVGSTGGTSRGRVPGASLCSCHSPAPAELLLPRPERPCPGRTGRSPQSPAGWVSLHPQPGAVQGPVVLFSGHGGMGTVGSPGVGEHGPVPAPSARGRLTHPPSPQPS